MKIAGLLFPLLCVAFSAEAQTFDACEDCELLFEGMPTAIASSVRIAGPEEPGEPLVMEGTIFQPDGKTPAPGIVLYFYQTDASGRYTPASNQSKARRHGHLRGWVKSDAKGKYSFTTVRPGSYPNSKNPQHIHPILVESNTRYYWIDEFLFTDDPLLTANEISHQSGRGGSGIVTLRKDAQGVWHGNRDIILGRGVPGYQPTKK